MIFRAALALLLTACSLAAQTTAQERSLSQSIQANTLKAHVSFLASDALGGRDTPSSGLETAAEYIASQYRRFGLEPSVKGSYFQNADFVQVTQPMEGFSLQLEAGEVKWKAEAADVRVEAASALASDGLAVLVCRLPWHGEPRSVEGKAIVVEPAGASGYDLLLQEEALRRLGAKVIITPGQTGMPETALRPAEAPGAASTPLIRVKGRDFRKFAADLAEGNNEAKLSVHVPAPQLNPVTLRNVIGVLPGSDPRLADEYVLISAHYDHVGTRGPAGGDRIFNGANDDASGVATVLALAEAFSPKKNRPARTLVFITYFGEEEGMFGSKYYAHHPVFPLARTVAALNFEHMGRTDDLEGDRTGKITASGFDFTTLGDTLTQAAKETGLEAWMHPQKSTAFFDRSDNQPLADEGIPSVTIAVAWIFPDYHRPSDEWEKLNYPNMESAVRTAALAVSIVANSKEVPQWNRSNPKTARYVKAWESLHGTH